jgi:hypothetical protein
MVVKKRDWALLCKQAEQAVRSGCDYSLSDFCRDKGISRVRLYKERSLRRKAS